MSSRTQDNNDNQDDQDSQGNQRPRRQARLRTASTDPQSDDDDSYEPSSDGNQEPEENRGDTLGKIYALNYVGKDHLLLPLPRVRILDNAGALKNQTQKHPEFW
jgi:hypothetical protein